MEKLPHSSLSSLPVSHLVKCYGNRYISGVTKTVLLKSKNVQRGLNERRAAWQLRAEPSSHSREHDTNSPVGVKNKLKQYNK